MQGNPPDLAAAPGDREWLVYKKTDSNKSTVVTTQLEFEARRQGAIELNCSPGELASSDVTGAPSEDVTEAPERLAHLVMQRRELQTRMSDMVKERRSNDLTNQVREFHIKFGYPVRETATRDIPEEQVKFRARLVAEEFLELMQALYKDGDFGEVRRALNHVLEKDTPNVMLIDLADACGDLDYVVEGTRLTLGIPRQKVANEIHRTNMLKEGGARLQGKLQKPEGWKPPDIRTILLDTR